MHQRTSVSKRLISEMKHTSPEATSLLYSTNGKETACQPPRRVAAPGQGFLSSTGPAGHVEAMPFGTLSDAGHRDTNQILKKQTQGGHAGAQGRGGWYQDSARQASGSRDPREQEEGTRATPREQQLEVGRDPGGRCTCRQGWVGEGVS